MERPLSIHSYLPSLSMWHFLKLFFSSRLFVYLSLSACAFDVAQGRPDKSTKMCAVSYSVERFQKQYQRRNDKHQLNNDLWSLIFFWLFANLNQT